MSSEFFDRVQDPVAGDPRRLISLQLLVMGVATSEWVVRRLVSTSATVGDRHWFLGLFLVFGMILAMIGIVRGQSTRLLSRWAAALAILVAFADLPGTANHTFLMALCLLILSMVHLDDVAERRLALHTLRWLWLLVLAASGVQKIAYGLYAEGQMLAYMIATEPSFQSFFGLLMPAEEVARLTALVPEGGPFVSEWVPLKWLSLGVVAFELLAPILLLVQKTRPLGILCTAGFILAIELGAREVFFGAIALGLTLLFARRDWIGKVLPLLGLALLLIIAIAADWLWPSVELF